MTEKILEDSVNFTYEGSIYSVQSYLNDTIDHICHQFLIKANLSENSVYFLISGKKIDENIKKETLQELKIREKINEVIIVAESIDKPKENKDIIKSKNIICPQCKENIRIKINDYKIYLYDCKNGHKINSILFDEFDNTKEMDISKIICDECKKINKSTAFQNTFYVCFKCNKNICPLCKQKHDKNHVIINFDEKDFKCKNHYNSLIIYCKDCKKNICLMCNEHNNHNCEFFGDIIPNIDRIKEKMNVMKKELDSFNNIINTKINKLRKIIENMEKYYNILNNILTNFDSNNNNYEVLNNINYINSCNFLNEIKDFKNNKNDNDFYNKIDILYSKMINKDVDEVNLEFIYKKQNGQNNIVKFFGKEFVDNNKKICKIIIDNHEYELKEKLNINNKDNEKFVIKLKGISNITNMSHMFSGCSSLLSISGISNWNTSNITNMSYMFNGCSSLSYVPDISKWNTRNVIDISYMFNECSSLSSLPDISNWDTSNVINMSYMFSGCSSLKYYPNNSELSKYNIINLNNMFKFILIIKM